MRKRRRVPEVDSKFDAYIAVSSKALQSGSPIGAVRLGLTTDEKNTWLDFYESWKAAYVKYNNPEKRTSLVIQNKNGLKRDFWTFSSPVLNKIFTSPNLTSDDRATFNLPLIHRSRSARGAMYEGIPTTSIATLGGSRLKVRVRMPNSEGRPRKHPLADAVEIKYLFLDINAPYADINLSPDDCPYTHVSKRAILTIEVGFKNLGKRIILFARWVNFTNPTHNSGWSMADNAVVG